MEYRINLQGRVMDVYMSDSFTFNDHEKFKALLSTIRTSDNIDDITMNVRGVDFIDSAAIGMLIIAHDEAVASHKNLTITGARDQVQMALEIADLKAMLHLK